MGAVDKVQQWFLDHAALFGEGEGEVADLLIGWCGRRGASRHLHTAYVIRVHALAIGKKREKGDETKKSVRKTLRALYGKFANFKTR